MVFTKPPTTPHVILIVEDDYLLRSDAVLRLQERGYRILEAANADEAIALLEHRSDISVIFTDIDMPGSMNGLKLAHAVRHRWPPIKIIATSGHSGLQDDELPSGGKFVAKPYSFRQLTDLIQAVTLA
jgi:CheY-like chemotaxis protein